jgi:hypothetical protein
MWATKRPKVKRSVGGPSDGIFVGISAFHIVIIICIVNSNLENVVGLTPATQSGLCGAFIPFMGFASSAVRNYQFKSYTHSSLYRCSGSACVEALHRSRASENLSVYLAALNGDGAAQTPGGSSHEYRDSIAP